MRVDNRQLHVVVQILVVRKPRDTVEDGTRHKEDDGVRKLAVAEVVTEKGTNSSDHEDDEDVVGRCVVLVGRRRVVAGRLTGALAAVRVGVPRALAVEVALRLRRMPVAPLRLARCRAGLPLAVRFRALGLVLVGAVGDELRLLNVAPQVDPVAPEGGRAGVALGLVRLLCAVGGRGLAGAAVATLVLNPVAPGLRCAVLVRRHHRAARGVARVSVVVLARLLQRGAHLLVVQLTIRRAGSALSILPKASLGRARRFDGEAAARLLFARRRGGVPLAVGSGDARGLLGVGAARNLVGKIGYALHGGVCPVALLRARRLVLVGGTRHAGTCAGVVPHAAKVGSHHTLRVVLLVTGRRLRLQPANGGALLPLATHVLQALCFGLLVFAADRHTFLVSGLPLATCRGVRAFLVFGDVRARILPLLICWLPQVPALAVVGPARGRVGDPHPGGSRGRGAVSAGTPGKQCERDGRRQGQGAPSSQPHLRVSSPVQ
eukprot:Rhum_TRINITY_DN2733_c0_g1::Rhum_TRINITY_DN2733_c0_g1_i1::g.8202::m.8202